MMLVKVIKYLGFLTSFKHFIQSLNAILTILIVVTVVSNRIEQISNCQPFFQTIFHLSSRVRSFLLASELIGKSLKLIAEDSKNEYKTGKVEFNIYLLYVYNSDVVSLQIRTPDRCRLTPIVAVEI